MNSMQSQLYSNGRAIKTNIVSIDIYKTVNKIPSARVMLCEGDEDDKTVIEMSSEACFKPGAEIELLLVKENENFPFKGIVTKQSVKKTPRKTYLTIDIRDKAHQMTLVPKSAVFNDKQDKLILKEIVETYQLTFACSEETLEHKQIVQYYCTDWDFIVSRAEANGLLVCVENGEIKLKKASLAAASTQLSGIFEYEIEADTSGQYDKAEASSWNIKDAANVKAASTEVVSLEGTHNFSDLAKAMGGNTRSLVSGIHSEKEELEAWANAAIIKNRHSLIRGRISVYGNPAIGLCDCVTFAEAGELYNSTTLISGIRHRFTSGSWKTDVQCGLSNKWFYKNDDIVEKPASGLLPGINGLQVGIVEAFPSDGDPDKFHRIKIRIPAVDEKQSVLWARLLFPYAGDTRGMFWVPEEGDEVVVGFFNDDPRHAVVIGALYNGQTETPLEFTDKNQEKGFITKNDIRMIFTDEDDKEKLEITTPGGNSVLIEDENGIIIKDKNENTITLNDEGMLFEDKNKNKITTDDKGTILEDTNQNALTCSSEGIEIKDLNGNSITLGSAGVEIKDKNGNKVSLEAAGITIKGTMVNIN